MRQRRFDRRELGAIYVGGVIGALAPGRPVGGAAARRRRLAVGDLRVNMIGAALLGWFVTRLGERLPPSTYRRPFLATGLCGALTTFSTLQLELFKMIEGGYLGAGARLRGGDDRRRLRLRPLRHRRHPPREGPAMTRARVGRGRRRSAGAMAIARFLARRRGRLGARRRLASRSGRWR